MDPRWPRSLERGNKFMLYVSDAGKEALKSLLEVVPLSEARSFSAAIVAGLKAVNLSVPGIFSNGLARVRLLLDQLNSMQFEAAHAPMLDLIREGILELLPELLFAALLNEPKSLLGRELTSAEEVALHRMWVRGRHAHTILVEEDEAVDDDMTSGSLAHKVALGEMSFDDYMKEWLDGIDERARTWFRGKGRSTHDTAGGDKPEDETPSG